MAKVANVFTSGRMNSDTHASFHDNKGYVRAKNLRISGKGNNGAFQFIKGSKQVINETEVGYVIVGAYEGDNNKNYFLSAMPNGKSKIIEYDTQTQNYKTLIQESQFLRFDLCRWNNGVEIIPHKFILSINQIGNLLFISGEYWEYPRVINITRDYSAGINADDIILAKKPPRLAPEIISLEKKGNEGTDKDSFISFSYRYKYIDGDYSALSFYSDTVFEPVNDQGVNAKREKLGMVNRWDHVKLMVNSGDKNVTDVEVFAIEHGSNTAYQIYTVNKEKASIADNTSIMNIEYEFSKNYEVLDEPTTMMLYSNVPKFPKTQTTAGNRIIYANYKEGFDLENDVDFEIRKYQTEYATDFERKTAVSMFKYKVGVVFLNDYNESTTVLLPLNQTKSEIEITFADRLKNNHIQAKLLTQPPSFATKMKWVVKSDELNYENVHITYAKKIGTKAYLLLKGDNVNRVKKGDIIIRTDSAMTSRYEYEVDEVDIFDIDDGLTVKGLYAVIEVGDEFIVESNNLPDLDTGYNGGIHELDSEISHNPLRFVSVGAASGEKRFWNLGRVSKSDIGQIREGDVVNLGLLFVYHAFGALDQSVSFQKEMYSSADYANPYVFFVNELKSPYFDISEDSANVYFRTNSLFPEYLQQQHPNVYNYDSTSFAPLWVSTLTVLKIKRGIKPQIFRTKNKELLNSFYFETHKTYPIINGQVIPDATDVDGKPLFNIDFYNGYCWGNGTESYKIKDLFTGKKYSYKFRPNQHDIKGYKRIHRKYDITYSGIYNHELGINQLSVFNPTLINWKDLPIGHGEIQRIISTDGDITVFTTDKVIVQYYGKSIIMDMQGSQNIGMTNEVLGSHQVLPYEFGISNNPESVATYSNMVFFIDKDRNRFLVKQGKEIQELNSIESGFYHEGIEVLKSHSTFLGSFDESNNEYLIGLDQKTILGFNLNNKGFTAYYTYKFDYLLGGYGEHYSAYKGKVYLDEATDDYNNFAGQGNKEASLTYIVAAEMESDKVFKAMYLQSNTAWDTKVKTNLTASEFSENTYQKRESYYYSDIFRDSSTALGVVGISSVLNIEGNTLVFKNQVTNQISVGDSLFNESMNFTSEITAINKNTITVADASGFALNEFIAGQKKQMGSFRPSGVPMRGKWMEVTLCKYGSDPYYLSAVYTEIIKSRL